MENSIYTVEYFINKFDAVPSWRWTTNALVKTKYFLFNTFCAQGLCLMECDYQRAKEATKRQAPLELNLSDGYDELVALQKLLGGSLMVAKINNGNNEQYQQPTPKQRVLAALYDIYEKTYGRKYGEVETSKEKIVYKTVLIDEAVKTLQTSLTEN